MPFTVDHVLVEIIIYDFPDENIEFYGSLEPRQFFQTRHKIIGYQLTQHGRRKCATSVAIKIGYKVKYLVK